jgi:anti-sigma-K factor RskA
MTRHDQYAESLAAYALDALDATERAAFEAHLASCEICQRELVDLRRVSVGIGLSVAPEPPPASLRSRVLDAAAGRSSAPREEPGRAPAASTAAASRIPWLVAAASAAIAIGAILYALSMRAELQTVRTLAAQASDRVETLRTELMRLRQDSTRLQQVVSVISAPDARQARLSGAGPASAATGVAIWSPATGLVVNARQLPPAEPGRGYELWAIAPGGAPISVGMLPVAPDGTVSHAIPRLPAIDVEQIAVSIEQAGGSPTGRPLGDIVLSGRIAG